MTTLRPSIAVFGGDRADAQLGAHVTLFQGTEGERKRLCAALRAGSYRVVVLMMRWMSHNQKDTIRAAAAGRAQVHYWNRGHGELRKYLSALVGTSTPIAGMPSLQRGTATTSGQAQNEDDAPPSAEDAARNAGFTVACFEARHDACEYGDAAQVKCGCSCHPLVTEEPEVSQPETRSAEGAAAAPPCDRP